MCYFAVRKDLPPFEVSFDIGIPLPVIVPSAYITMISKVNQSTV